MDLGRQGIAASRAGMEVVGRNISNAADANYTRQEIFFESPAQGGVRTWTVRSQVDAFIESRLATESQTQGRLEVERRLMGEVSAVFGTTESGLNASMADFFAAVSGNLVGMIGSSNNPISGLTLSTLIIAALLIVIIGVKGDPGVAAVLGVASVVCVSSAVAGEMPSMRAASSSVSPAKKRSLTSSALVGSSAASFVSAPSRSSSSARHRWRIE